MSWPKLVQRAKNNEQTMIRENNIHLAYNLPDLIIYLSDTSDDEGHDQHPVDSALPFSDIED